MTRRLTSIRQMASLLGIGGREASILVTLGIAYAAFEGIGVSMLLPLLKYVERGTVLLQNDAGSNLVSIVARVTGALGIPFGFPTLAMCAFLPILARQIFRYLHQVYAERLRLDAIVRVRSKGFAAFLNAPLTFFAEEGQGRLVGVLTSEVERGTAALLLSLQLSEAAILLTVYLVLLVYLAAWLVPVVLVAMALVAVFVRARIQRSRAYGKIVSAGNEALQKSITERLAGVRLVKVTGNERRETAAVDGIVRTMTEALYKICRVREGLEVSVEPVVVLGAFVALYVAVTFFSMTLASLGVFMFVLLRMVPLLKQVNVARQGISSLVASLENVRVVIERAVAADNIVGGSLPFTALRQEIVFERVSFSYGSDRETWALRDVSFTVPKGTLTAIVGRSGAGKSTLLDLIPRLRDLSEGDIWIDGVSIREFDIKRLRAGIGIVDQQGFLFDDTVANNIKYGRRGATREAIVEAAKQAYAHHFIVELPRGYDSVVGEAGIKLSMGQRQRLNLARVLLQDPEILLLDEPTSALDSESEQYIQAVLDGLRQRKAIIVVAHRFSTIRRADQIIVLDRGRVVEQGDHETLLKDLGTYKQLYDLQVHA